MKPETLKTVCGRLVEIDFQLQELSLDGLSRAALQQERETLKQALESTAEVDAAFSGLAAYWSQDLV